jgi:hypothetical protein
MTRTWSGRLGAVVLVNGIAWIWLRGRFERAKLTAR